MLKLQNISLTFGERYIFNELDLFFGEKDKVGLVGKNGAGKSTLLRVITGSQSLTAGEVIKPKDLNIGYLPQDLEFNSDLPIYDEVAKAFGATQELEAQMERITAELNEREDYESDAYMQLAESLNEAAVKLGVYDVDGQDEQIERILLGLGFSRSDFTKSLSAFSGGWKMRVALAKILLSQPDLILLDEPTNHLDIESVEWLEGYLKNFNSAVVLISHDRFFLDRVTNRTVELINGKSFDYPVNYSRFVELRKDVIRQQQEAKKNQEKEIKQTEALINKFRAKSSKAAFAQSLIKKLDKMQIIEVDDLENSSFQFSFPPAPRSGKTVVKAENLGKRYGEKKVFQGLDFEILRGDRIALVGKNGVGKTTLTKVIAGLTAHQGHCELGSQVHLGYYSQHQSDELPSKSTALEVIDQEATGDIRTQVRNLLGAFMFQGDDVFKPVSVLSGGEKARLALCKLLLHRYNFLILDEPTNHLDMRSKDVLKSALNRFDGTLLVVSHDREFLQGLSTKVMEIKDGDITVFPGAISEFLERKRADTIREFERVKPAKAVRQRKDEGSEKDRWSMGKRVNALEREIADLEKKLLALRAQASALDYSEHQAVRSHMEQQQSAESLLEQKMQEWTLLNEQLDA